MMKFFKLSIVIGLCIIVSHADAQRRAHYGGHRSGAANAWIFGLHWSYVYSAGTDFGNVFKLDNWHGAVYPSKGTIEKYLSTDWSVEGSATMNHLGEDKIFDSDTPLSADSRLYSADLNAKYRFVRFFIVKGFDPYVLLGTGVTRAKNETGVGFNVGIGFNTWLGNGWGLNFQTVPKIGLGSKSTHQYIQNSFGIVYRYFISDIGARRLERQQNLLGGNSAYRR